MANKSFNLRRKSPKSNRELWVDRWLAIAALINLLLVLFDLSYIPWRKYYFWYAPVITRIYDPVKGIEPNQKTQIYINTVKQLKSAITSSGLNSERTDKLLKELQASSQQMLDADLNSIAQKTGTIEKLKNRMRQHMDKQSSSAAFTEFWTVQNLQAKSWQSEINFYETQIQPLIITNYFRKTDEYDDYVDYFTLIDLGFIAIFAIDIARRIQITRLQNRGMTWGEATRSRWYDFFLIIPFWRWLRILPVTIRLHQAEFIDLSPIEREIDRYLVKSLAEAVTREVVIQILNQIQALLKESDMSEVIKNRLQAEYIDINNVNEVKVITKLIYKISVDRVIPKLQPQIESLFQHALEKVILQLPIYQNISQIPGVGQIPVNIAHKILEQTSEAGYQIIIEILKDPDGIKLSEELLDNLLLALSEELQKKQTWRKLQYLLTDMLEEVKINYIQNLSETDLPNLGKR